MDTKDAHLLMVQPLQDAGLHAAAVTHLERARQLDPHDPSLLLQAMVLLPLVFESDDHILEVRATLRDALDMLRRSESSVYLSDLPAATLQLCYHGVNDRALITEIERTFAAACPALTAPGEFKPSPAASSDDSRRRVAFVSAHFRWHSVCSAVCGTIEKLAEDGRVHVTVVFAPSTELDQVSKELIETTHAVMYLPGGLDEASLLLTQGRFDVLVFTDVGMHPWSSNLAHRRSAAAHGSRW